MDKGAESKGFSKVNDEQTDSKEEVFQDQQMEGVKKIRISGDPNDADSRVITQGDAGSQVIKVIQMIQMMQIPRSSPEVMQVPRSSR